MKKGYKSAKLDSKSMPFVKKGYSPPIKGKRLNVTAATARKG